LAFLYNSDYEHGVPHLPQNFAVGFSVFPQLLQDEDVSFFSAGFLATYLLSYSSSSSLAGFDVPDPLFTAKTIPITAPPITAAPPAI